MINLTFNEAKEKISLSLFGFPYEQLHSYNKSKVDNYMKDLDFIEHWLTIREHKEVKVEKVKA